MSSFETPLPTKGNPGVSAGDYTEADNRADGNGHADGHADAGAGDQGRRPDDTMKRPGADYLPGSTLICAICLDTVEYGETKRTLPCTHSYHSTCVRAWLKRVNRCPQCNNATVKERQRGIRRARRDARDAAAMAAAALASSGVIGPTSAGAVTAGAEGGSSVGVGGGVGGDGVGDGGGAAATGSSSGPAPEFVVVPLGEEAAAASAAPSADGGRLSAVGGEAGSAGEGGPATAVPCPQAPVEV